MISQVKDIDKAFLDGLRKNHYSRRIKSHFLAYGTDYEFSRFFTVGKNGEIYGIISIFNSSMMISTMQGKTFDRELIGELGAFIMMNKPSSLELEVRYAQRIKKIIEDEYYADNRTQFQFCSDSSFPELSVNELPKLDDVFAVLKTSFPALAESYELWLTDTSHRVRRGLSQSFLLGDYTTATIQYIIDGVALIGHVATVPQERGKYHARKLLYWIGEKLTRDGFSVHLLARPHRVSYYEEIGFKQISSDIVFERKNINE